jgi:hypothetical protein
MPDGIEQRRNSKIITSTLLALLIWWRYKISS